MHYSNEAVIEMDLSVPNGVYLLTIISGNKRAVMKVIKE